MTAALLVTTGPAAPSAQGAGRPPNPSNAQINHAKAAKAALATRVGTLSAKVADLQNQVAQRQADAELAEQKLAAALQQLNDAKAAVAAARTRLSAAATKVNQATAQFSEFVRDSYMASPIDGTAAAGLITASDPNALLVRSEYLNYSANHRLDIINAMSAAKVERSNADAASRGAEQRQLAATDAASKARQGAADALAAVQAAQRQTTAQLGATQSSLSAAQLQLATLNKQRAQFIAWQKEQARLAAERAAAAARARAAAAAALAARQISGGNGCTPHGTALDAGNGTPAQVAVSRALLFLGCPYAYAGGNYDGPTYGVCVPGDAFNDCNVYGFDCSGLALFAYAPFIHLVHYAATQYSEAGSFHPSTSQLRPGDLVFWSSDGTVAGIHHVAIYIGGGNVIQAPQSGDIVRITPLDEVDVGYFGATRPLS